MKKLFKLLSISLCLATCILISGCSCGRPVGVKYSVSAWQGERDQILSTSITVKAVLTKKFREPASTPCYKKVTGGKYVELLTAERYDCYTKDCYKKSDGKYVLMSKDQLEVSACISGDFKCYEKSDITYYKLLSPEDAEGRSQCYNSIGEKFERATYSMAEKMELENNTAVSKRLNLYSFNSSKTKVPSNENYSLIYDFEIINNESRTIYVEALDLDTITKGKVKKSGYKKIKLTEPTLVFMEDKYYYAIPANGSKKISIQIKYLLSYVTLT